MFLSVGIKPPLEQVSNAPARLRSFATVRIALAQDGRSTNYGSRDLLAVAHAPQPGADSRSGCDPLKFAEQELLHRLTLRGRTGSQFVANLVRDTAYGDLYWHDCISPAIPA